MPNGGTMNEDRVLGLLMFGRCAVVFSVLYESFLLFYLFLNGHSERFIIHKDRMFGKIHEHTN